MISLSNATMDKIVGLTTVDAVDRVIIVMMNFLPEMDALGNELTRRLESLKA
jgi:hypothetical protein